MSLTGEAERSGAGWLKQAVAIWLIVAAIFIVTKWQAIMALALPDADDTLRLIQLRDLAAGQGWFDPYQHRINPPEGVLMHWSRLVDAPLLLMRQALSPLMGPALAEHVTLVAVPLLTLGAAIALTMRLGTRLIGAKGAGYACLVLVLSTPVTGQLQPLRIDHHGWQIVAVLGALNGLAALDARRGGWIAGISLALGMSISLELLPLAVLFAAAFALRWFIDANERAGLIHFLLSLTVTSAAALLATHGLVDLANHCDTLSPAYIAGIAVAAAGITVLGQFPKSGRVALLLGLGTAGVAAAIAILTIAPQCSTGPFTTLDPLVRSFWYNNVHEGMPVWLQKPPVLAQMIVPPMIGLLASLQLWRESTGAARRHWLEYTLVLVGALALAVVVARSSAFACAIAAVPLGWLLMRWHDRIGSLRSPAARIAVLAGMTMAVMPGLPLLGLAALVPGSSAEAKAAPAQLACDIPAAANALERIPRSTIFAPIDIGPMLLAHTRHSVVATAHHRAPKALHDVIAAFIADPEGARAIVTAHGSRYVMICPGLIEVSNYRAAAPQGFMAALAQGNAPRWLKPVPLPRESGLMLWEVR